MITTLTCAFEFGTSSINAIAARRDADGQVTVLAIESEPANGCVRHGCIQNIEEAAAKIKHLAQKLGNRLSSQESIGIGKAYVGVAGISIHSMPHNTTLHLGEESEITLETLNILRQQSMNTPLQGYDLYDVEAMYYNIDGRDCWNPIGALGTEITAYNQLIIGRSHLKRNLQATMDRAGIEIAGFIALPLVTSHILTDIEKQQGCVLVNFGAATTTVAIYKQTLRHLAVIPLGGDVVTLDIMSCGLRHNEAENAKVKWSSAYPNDANDLRPSAIEQEAIGMEIAQLNNIVQCRYEEIIANIKHQIDLSGISEEINGGSIITGGAAVQKGLSTLLSQQLNMGVKTRTYTNITAGGAEKRVRYSSILCMISRATKDCRKEKPQPAPAEPTLQTQAPAATPPPQTPADDDGVKPLLDGIKGIKKTPKKGFKAIIGDLFFGMEEN